ncbi:hypothetical protein [Micromonospora robiginosa]|uniref:Uncharacterized protein n=1 Tax=Micromonospora robiginosa TaxID=2749844 RepID=A0A7L6B7X0_9ACTN|nr:hypothetical protein [Micromonospora ferruginea]QLQ37978.1 hypothetical protein H1D33_03540 [Micromonospora ferruginea]
MPSGGARARSGPPPDPDALARLRGTDAGWHVLPILGRPGPAPEWPLPNPSGRELELWAKLWAKPQATRWEVLGQEDEVALYCRRFVRAEQPDAPVATVVVVRQLGEALGLTIPGLLRNRWQIGGGPGTTAAAPAGQTPTGTDGAATPAASSRQRLLRSVPSDGS